MGKVTGGTARLNNMIYARGAPSDYPMWYKDVKNFNYEQEILYYFKKAENQQGLYAKDSKNRINKYNILHYKYSKLFVLAKFHSSSIGPLDVTDLPYTTVAETVLKAIEYLGYKITDLNAQECIGIITILETFLKFIKSNLSNRIYATTS